MTTSYSTFPSSSSSSLPFTQAGDPSLPSSLSNPTSTSLESRRRILNLNPPRLDDDDERSPLRDDDLERSPLTHDTSSPLSYQRLQVLFFVALFLAGIGVMAISPLAAMISLLSRHGGETNDQKPSSTMSSSLSSSPISITLDAVKKTYVVPNRSIALSPRPTTANSLVSYWVYEYSIPILRLASTTNVTIKLRNNLERETPESSTSRAMNVDLRYPNTTVTHFHGLHVSPANKGDNMFRSVAPQTEIDYEIVLENHAPGTFWTHAHFHGSSSIQTAFHVRFPLIVEDDAKSVMRSAVEIIAMVGLGGRGSGHTSSDVHEAFSRAGSPVNSNLDSINSPSIIEFVTINDVVAPLKLSSLDSSKLHRIRVINTAADGVLKLSWNSDDPTTSPPPPHCPDVALIAVDGVYLRKGPILRHNGLVLPPGGRADYILTLNGQAPCILSSQFDRETREILGLKSKVIEGDLLILSSSVPLLDRAGAGKLRWPRGPPPPLPRALPLLPSYMLEDLRHAKAHFGDSESAVERRTIVFDEFIYTPESPESGEPPAESHAKHAEIKYGVDGQPYSDRSRFSIRLGRIQEWTILNRRRAPSSSSSSSSRRPTGGNSHEAGSPRPSSPPPIEAHPFHMHTNPFQVVRDFHNINNHDEANWWRDTIVIPPLGNVTIRFRPLHFTGKTLLHCHTLSHSDQGMNLAFDIIE